MNYKWQQDWLLHFPSIVHLLKNLPCTFWLEFICVDLASYPPTPLVHLWRIFFNFIAKTRGWSFARKREKMEFLWRRISLSAAAIFNLKWTAHTSASKIILKEARPSSNPHFPFSAKLRFHSRTKMDLPRCQPPQNVAQTQLDLLLAALISNSTSSSSTNLNLLNNLASLLGIGLPFPPSWPSPLPFSPQFPIGHNNNNLQHLVATQFDNNPRAHCNLLIPTPPSQICSLPTIPLLPTCAMPDFNAHLWALSAGQSNFLAMTSAGDLPLPSSSLPSPSDTSSSTSSSSIIGEEIRNNSEEATIEVGTKNNANNNNDPNIRCHRLSYPREFKLIVLHSFWANGQNKYRTCKEFQITKSMLNGWLQKANKIRNSRPGSLKSGRSGRRPQFPKIERQLFGLLRQQIANGNEPQQISNKWIRENARRLAEMELESAADGRNENGMDGGQIPCQFSERWVNNFKRRFGILKEGEELILEEEVDVEATKDGQKLMENSAGNSDEQQQQNLAEDLNEKDLERIGREICASSSIDGQLPIQAFYARFPKVSIGNEQK